GVVEHDADRRRDRAARHPRADARHGADADPDAAAGAAVGSGRRDLLAVHAVGELRARAGAERDWWAVRRDDLLTRALQPVGQVGRRCKDVTLTVTLPLQEALLQERQQVVPSRLVGDAVTRGVRAEGVNLVRMAYRVPEQCKLPTVEVRRP